MYEGTLEEISKNLAEDARKRRAGFNRHREIYEYAFKIVSTKFSTQSSWTGDKTKRFYELGYDADWNDVRLTLHIAENERIEVGYPVIDTFIKERRDFEMLASPSKELSSTELLWTFRKSAKSYQNRIMIDIIIDASRSTSCKLVPTGEFTKPYERMKLVCS